MTHEEAIEKLMKVHAKIKREKAAKFARDFHEYINKEGFTHDQLVEMYNAIVERLLSPE